MVDPREDEPDPLGHEGGNVPLWDRLVTQLGARDARIKTAARAKEPLVDMQPIMLERFEIQRAVGMGGMGMVFEAIDPGLGRRVALKVCMGTYADAATDLEHEARCLAKLSHPNIVAIYEVLRVESEIVLVMDFVDGQTLHQWRATTRPSWREVLARCIDAGRALAAVHAAGLEYRDFKPNNVMIDREGRVRVIDFGIARYSIGPSVPDEAGEIVIKGTAPYMPPERHMGKEPLTRKPGYPLADIYAFSVSVWESLYGVRPYAGETVPALLESILTGKLETGTVGAGVVPDAVRDVLKRGLSLRASERPQSMDELLRALTDAADGARARRARWRRRVEVGLGMVMVGATVFMAAMLWRVPERDEVERGAPPVSEPAPVAAPQPGVVAQNLALAVEAARAGHPDSALTHLDLARSRARADDDAIALREVATQAEALGDEFDLLGEKKLRAQLCWEIAWDIIIDLPNATATADRLRMKLKSAQSR